MLILHQSPLSSENQPATGESQRILQLRKALNASTVFTLQRRGDLHNWAELIQQAIISHQPKTIVILQLEDAALLPAELPEHCVVIIDLFAPRIIETSFEPPEIALQLSAACLAGLRRGDIFLTSNSLQRQQWLSVLALCGVCLEPDPTVMVSLASPAPQSLRESRNPDPLLIGGGKLWPWQNPFPQLLWLLEELDHHQLGTVQWFGDLGETASEEQRRFVEEHPRFNFLPLCSINEYREHLHNADLAVDVDWPSVEREAAIGFRHMEYLSAGLPIMCLSNNILAEHFPAAVIHSKASPTKQRCKALVKLFLLNWQQQDLWLDRKRAALEHAKDLSSPSTTAALRQRMEQHDERPRARYRPWINPGESEIRKQLSESQQREQRILIESLTQDAVKKSEELERLTELNNALQGSLVSLSEAVRDVGRFKHDAAVAMGNAVHQSIDRADVLSAENARLQSDLAKKGAELVAMDLLRARLEHDLSCLRQELANAQSRSVVSRLLGPKK